MISDLASVVTLKEKLIEWGIVAAVCFAGGAYVGWQVTTWQRDSAELAADKAAAKATAAFVQRESTIASDVQAALVSYNVKSKTIDRGIVREVVTNEKIYLNDCLADTGVRLLNAAASGNHNASQPAGEVSNNAASTPR